MRLDDTIAAIATPMIPSGIGIIRVSGKGSISIVARLFKGSSLKNVTSHRLIHGWIQDKGELIDKVLVVVMRAPKSYTTEDVVEIQCHGSPFVLRKILDLILKDGARLANPGEFTQRAFLNGRIDLTQVEAVSDLINASSDIGAKLAAEQINGKLFNAIDAVKNKVVYVASIVEAIIEFPEEVHEFNKREECINIIEGACADLKKLLTNAELGLNIRDGFTVTLIGRPNVGKSSLLNILLKEQRAIVTDVPGTTRDSIEELVQINSIPFLLTDTAGIRESGDPIESEGIRRTQIAREKANLVLLVLDGSENLKKDDFSLIKGIEKKKSIVVINKKDLITSKLPSWYKSISGLESILISAKNGEGCKDLESLLYTKATMGGIENQDQIWITNRRQLQATKNALSSLSLAREVLEKMYGEEFLAVDLKSCLNYLGEIVGETTPDDLLEKIFSEFCIGK